VKLSARQTSGLSAYVGVIEALRTLIRDQAPIHEILEETIERTGYLQVLEEDPDTAEDREQNLEELVSKAAEWEDENPEGTLTEFLEELFLKSHQDTVHAADALRLMTIHNGKGLEFTTTFLVGMEEELFPHANALGDFNALEEERRLCYVGMTRAKEYLYLTAAKTRYLFGSLRPMRPSRFLSEIPEERMKKYHTETFSPYDFAETSTTLQPGDRVQHRDFGEGIVQKSYSTSLGLTYDVLFVESNEERSLVAKYAKLSKAR
jgi:DNA helicase-2/ATP-dependent DNA helicase PcrA